MTVNRIRLEVQEFSDHIIQETKDIGDLGGSGQPDINASQQPFTLYQAIKEASIDHVDVSHEGIAQEESVSSSSDLIEHIVRFSLYRIPTLTRISQRTASMKIAADIDVSVNAPSNLRFVLTEFDSSITINNATRFSRGDRLVLGIDSTIGLETTGGGSSSSSELAATSLAGVVAAILGRTVVV